MTNQNKINSILDAMDDLQENLLALSDDMLLSIDSHDNESIEEGAKFLKEYNTSLSKFSSSAQALADHIKTHFGVNPEIEDVESEISDEKKRNRIIKELDKTEPHALGENFTYKRPFGFVLQDSAYKGLKTWKHLYMLVLDYLCKQDKTLFQSLPAEKKFISRRGNPQFSLNPKDLRVADQSNGLYIEVNLSANCLMKNIATLLDHFQIAQNQLRIYLREDRDA
jgi:hypothetical protein